LPTRTVRILLRYAQHLFTAITLYIMQTIFPTSSDLSPEQVTLFQHGASCIIHKGENSAALWHQHTPEHEGSSLGTIGAVQLENTASAVTFLQHCAQVLKDDYQCETIVGPMNANTWLKHRLILDSSGRDPFLMEPIEPDYYRNLFEQAGFEILSRYSSSHIDLTVDQPEFPKLEQRMKRNDVQVRTINQATFEQDLEAIYDLCLIGFASNFLYTPLPKDAFMQQYAASNQHIDSDFVLLAERPTANRAELVGFVFCMPDLLAHQHGKQPALIVKTLACLPERPLSGLGTVLVSRVQQAAKTKGYTEAIHALQFESNTSLRISQRFNATAFRQYGLMVKFASS